MRYKDPWHGEQGRKLFILESLAPTSKEIAESVLCGFGQGT